MTPIKIDSSRLQWALAQLATFTHVEPAATGTAVTRVVFTPDDLAARAWLKSIAKDAGLAIREDAVGNTFFRLEGIDPELQAVATGSHIDAIPHAGMYDGTVGVLGGLEALQAIQATGVRHKRSIELVLFTSEEPTRFGIGCLGSRLLSGNLSPERADDFQDTAGQTLREIRKAAGFSGTLDSVRLTPGHYKAFVELHIEQGPLLERAAAQIGVVAGIAAPAGYRFVVEGRGGHAGALLMPDRRDALCAAAEIILSVERHARATGSVDTVATVGTCEIYPGAVNSVPSRALLQLDVRDTDPKRRESVMRAVRVDVAELQARRGVAITETLVNADDPAICDPELVQSIVAWCESQSISNRTMVSRAYHDTLFMAAIAPVAMIFVPCREGISHRPEEYSRPEDIACGTQLLAQILSQLALD